jgi:hypothetical protein
MPQLLRLSSFILLTLDAVEFQQRAFSNLNPTITVIWNE